MVVLSNKVKIIIVIVVAILAIGLFCWWWNRPTKKDDDVSVSQRFLNLGDQYTEKAFDDIESGDHYNINRAIESYIEASNNGDEEGALSLARLYLNYDPMYSPERAYQIASITLENTRSHYIAQRCMEIINQVHPLLNRTKQESHHMHSLNVVNDSEYGTTPASMTPPQAQPQQLYDENEPIQISLTQDYRDQVIGHPKTATAQPIASMEVTGFGVEDIQSALATQAPVKVKGKKTPDTLTIRRKTNIPLPNQPTGAQRHQHNITINGKPAEILEDHGARVLMMDDEPILLPADLDINLIEQNLFNLMANVVHNMRPPKTKLKDRMKVRSDSQNVHDSNVVSGAKEIYIELSKLPNIKPFNQCEKELFTYIKDSEKRATITKVLRRIVVIETHLALNANGTQVFSAVWSKISNQPDETKRNNDIDNFILELCNCVDKNDNVLCSTGLMNRMLGVFEGTGDYEKAKMVPDSFYNAEMYGAAGKLQERLEKEGYDFDKEEDQNRFKQIFREDMKKEYVDSGHLAQEALDKKLLWLDDMF